jgi:hypothetical protein
VLVRRDPHAEVDVRCGGDLVLARADRADDRPLGDGVAALHRHRAELEQRYRVAVARHDRDGPTTAGQGARERDGASDGSAHARAERAADVDTAVLAAGVRIGAERKRTQHRALDRPRPRPGRGREGKQQQGCHGCCTAHANLLVVLAVNGEEA